MIKLTVDGRPIEAEEGKSLLHTCLAHGITIPNLCALEGMQEPPASCRLCFVEIEGQRKPVASCKVEPVDGMVVRTDTEPVRRLQRTALRLLLSVHRTECRICPSNKRCVLQQMAKFLSVRLRPRRLEHLEHGFEPPQHHPCLEFVPSRCVLCGRCVEVCQEQNGFSFLTFAERGFDTVITSLEEGLEAGHTCRNCRRCIEICPVSAILLKTEREGEEAS